MTQQRSQPQRAAQQQASAAGGLGKGSRAPTPRPADASRAHPAPQQGEPPPARAGQHRESSADGQAPLLATGPATRRFIRAAPAGSEARRSGGRPKPTAARAASGRVRCRSGTACPGPGPEGRHTHQLDALRKGVVLPVLLGEALQYLSLSIPAACRNKRRIRGQAAVRPMLRPPGDAGQSSSSTTPPRTRAAQQ